MAINGERLRGLKVRPQAATVPLLSGLSQWMNFLRFIGLVFLFMKLVTCHSLAGLSFAQCLQAAVSAWFGVLVVSCQLSGTQRWQVFHLPQWR
ncbi:hypothetical protein I8748_34590 [Nostoc sp. CENA67]|uniref:Uncharacterized protein n=1 Tax=Amazonocrinis nigriterrae CENA67 TaxID=2794033 RepID=A0A8J7HWJ3_9NOST|nr:hypothetical protein [Amazonocrinis nigriterrae]MBH8561656.1 hypothetical protein [Amazonocrinis nigriterrae CENA67]MBH8567221.1 hypothetical protein [Amazonocrinis nigriterrae CENA67]